MSIGSLLGLIATAGWVLLIAGIGLAVTSASQNRSPRRGVMLAVAGLVLGILFGIFSQGVIIVQPQEVAVVFDTISGNLLEPYGPGIHVIIPVVQEATLYSVERIEYTVSGVTSEGARQGNDAVFARTSDGQEVLIDATLIFRVNPEQVNLIHTNWQGRFVDELVRPTMRGIIRDEVALYGVEEVYSTERGSLRDGIQEGISARLEAEGLEVIDFLVRDVQFSEEYAQSVEQKQIAEQDRLRAEQEAERLRVQAQGLRDAAVYEAEGGRLSAVERATGEAERIRLTAEAEADAILIRAQADAQALALINEQISQNPNLIAWRYIDTLADNVQLVILPSNSPFLFDFDSLSGSLPTPASDDASMSDPLDAVQVPETPAADSSGEAATE